MDDLKSKLSISAKEMEELSSLSRELNDLVENNYQGIMKSLRLLAQGFPEEDILTFYPSGRTVVKLENVEFHILQYKWEEEEEDGEVQEVVREVEVLVPYGADLISRISIVQRALDCVKDILSWNAENENN